MSNTAHPDSPKKNKQSPPTCGKNSRFEKIFSHAQKIATGLKPDYEYAAELISQCVAADPANVEYAKTFIEYLQKKYNNNLSGASMAQLRKRSNRAAVKEALHQENWEEVIRNGVEVLKANPWDAPALTAMAEAAKKSGYFESELLFLKSALLGHRNDPALNRLVAIALGERLHYDQAMAYWRRVEEALPDDEEPKRAIAYLQTKKMGFQTEENKDVEKLHTSHLPAQKPEEELSIEKKLLKSIEEKPKFLPVYFELAQYYIQEEQFDKAAKVLEKAYEISNGDPDVREKWEDAQLRHFRHVVDKTDDPAKKNKLQQAYYIKELEFCKKRCERYPSNLFFRFDLGCRYMLTKQYNEAIRELQLSKGDPRRKGVSLLALGKCFQQIDQSRLAMSHYEQAVQEIPERDVINKKEALRLAGKLALSLDDLDTAEKYISILAAMDFNYKDVPALLDKIAQLRKNQACGDERGPI
ncbi:MAG: tetratricopeptide repeat protein, partial [Thermoguttaceae bacterium]